MADVLAEIHALGAEDEEILLPDGFDDAIVGLIEVFADQGRRRKVLYDRELIIERLVADLSQEPEAHVLAEEYYEFNIAGAYVGPGTPAFLSLKRSAT